MPLGWAFGFAALYVLPVLAMSVVATALARRRGEEPGPLIALVAGLGPLGASWTLVHGWTLLPGRRFDGNLLPRWPSAVSWGLVLLPSLVVLALGRRHAGAVRAAWSSLRRSLSAPFRPGGRTALLPLAVLAVVVVLVSARAVLLPLTENDAMEYASLARYLFETRDPGGYPVLTADPASGYYLSLSHPLGYPGLLLTSMVLQGTAEMTPFVKLVAPAYLVFLLLALAGTLAARGPLAILTALVLVAAAPAYATVVGDLQTDPVRMYPFFAALALAPWLAERDDAGGRALAALAVGMALYTHSMGVLVVPLFVVASALAGRWREPRPLLHSLAVVLGGALLLAGWRYVDNVRLFGGPISNTSPLFRTFDFRFQEYVRYGRELHTFAARLVASLLRGFTEVRELGIVFWVGAAALLLRVATVRLDRRGSAFTAVLLAYFGMAAVALLLNVDLFAMNVRHYMTLLPFAAYLAGVGIATAPPLVGALLAVTALSLFPMRALRGEFRKFPVTARSVRMTDSERMENGPGIYAHSRHVRELPGEGLFLVLRFSDFAYYVRRPMISDQDPRLLPVYRAASGREAHRLLVELGVRYVYQPGYTPPTVAETRLGELLGDPTLVELAYANGYHRVYRLRPRPSEAAFRAVPEGRGCVPSAFSTRDTYRLRLAVAPGRGYLSGFAREYGPDDNVEGELPLWDGLLGSAPREIVSLFRLQSPRTCGVAVFHRLSSGATFAAAPPVLERVAQPEGAGPAPESVEARRSSR